MPQNLVAYPSTPPTIGQTILSALDILRDNHGVDDFHPWAEHDVAGRFLITPILDSINSGQVLVADITRLNFNVVYEIGYAIGKAKRAFLVKNTALETDEMLVRDVGIFDTVGYQPYTTSRKLADMLLHIKNDQVYPLHVVETNLSLNSPVYVLLPKTKSDHEVHLLGRLKKSRLHFRTFDPEEHGRLSAQSAIHNVSISYGVIVPLLPSIRTESRLHNVRAAFVAGLASAMEKELLILQFGDDPVPLDFRDFVTVATIEHQIASAIAQFAPSVYARFQTHAPSAIKQPETFLARLSTTALKLLKITGL